MVSHAQKLTLIGESVKIFFTQSNTNGYTDSELAQFNKELEALLVGIDPLNWEAIAEIVQAFSDEVAGRTITLDR